MKGESRSDRKRYGVYVRRNRWVGYYYTPDGKRKSNVPCMEATGHPPRMTPLPVLTENPARCPNQTKALEFMASVADSTARPPVVIPPLREAVQAWHDYQLAHGGRPVPTAKRRQVILRMLEGIGRKGRFAKGTTRPLALVGLGWTSFSQVNARELDQFLQVLHGRGVSDMSRNAYLLVWRHFLKWAVGQGYIRSNPTDESNWVRRPVRVHNRRPLTPEEFRILAEPGRSKWALVYATLGLSGLRTTEAARLIKEDLDPREPRPVWKLDPSRQKTARFVTLPMLPQLAALLLPVWEKLAPGERLFKEMPNNTHFRRELEKLGIQKVNPAGQRLALHSFRFFFATQLARQMPARQVQALMRHSSFQLTMDLYAKLHLEDLTDRIVFENVEL